MIFGDKVLDAVSSIPVGFVTTYYDLASFIGHPRAVRAVGTALSKNKKLIEVPCHRVVKSSGEVGNYAKGTKEKIRLLELEGVEVKKEKINLGKYRFKFKI